MRLLAEAFLLNKLPEIKTNFKNNSIQLQLKTPNAYIVKIQGIKNVAKA